jgi:hypothetical protein
MRNNVYWKAQPPASKLRTGDAGIPLTFAGLSFADWQKSGKDAGSIIADPKFVDPDHDDYRLQADSPAPKLGFKPFDFSKAGVYGDAEWVKRATSATFPALQVAPPAPPPAP